METQKLDSKDQKSQNKNLKLNMVPKIMWLVPQTWFAGLHVFLTLIDPSLVVENHKKIYMVLEISCILRVYLGKSFMILKRPFDHSGKVSSICVKYSPLTFLPSSVPIGNCNSNWTELALFSVIRLVVSSLNRNSIKTASNQIYCQNPTQQ